MQIPQFAKENLAPLGTVTSASRQSADGFLVRLS